MNRIPAISGDWKPWYTFAVIAIVFSTESFAADESPKQAEEEFGTRIFLANADGSDMKALTVLPDYKAQGSPAWSRDGKMIAFDAELHKPNIKVRREVVVVNADGTNPRVLLDGYMPSFSPNGNRLVISRLSTGGVWLMSTEGPDVELKQLEASAWGSHWGADGRIVMSTRGPDGANLVIVDLVEGTREVLFAEPSPYRSILHNFKWSPDGNYIVFKGIRKSDNGSEVAIVDARGANYALVTRYDGEIWAAFGWRPDGTRLLFSQMSEERKHNQLYFLDPTNIVPPQLLPGQDPDRRHSDVAYSPDGKQLAISSGMRTALENRITNKPPAPK